MTSKSAAPKPQAATIASTDRSTFEPRIAIRISADLLTAYIAIRAGEPVGAEELENALQRTRVVSGVDQGAVERLTIALVDPDFEVADRVIACGITMEEGEHGRFEPLFHEGIQPGRLREDGTLDFQERDLLKPVQKGDAIGRIWPARPGRPGCLVDGSVVEPKPVKDLALSLGRGVERGADGMVRATRDGIVAYRPGQSLDVVDQLVHKGSVDLRSGHLNMQGSLQIQGDVESSFIVHATGDVEVAGSVENGQVYAGGSVRIKRGVRGGEGGLVCAHGNLSVHHAEAAKLYAVGLLQLGEGVHCELAGNKVEVSGKLRGGIVRAEAVVTIHEVGSPSGVETEIIAGEPVELPLDDAKHALELANVRTSKRAPALHSHRPAARQVRQHGEAPHSELQRLQERAHRREALCREAVVHIGLAHPGVVLRIGDRKLVIEHEIRASRFSIDAETGELKTDKMKI